MGHNNAPSYLPLTGGRVFGTISVDTLVVDEIDVLSLGNRVSFGSETQFNNFTYFPTLDALKLLATDNVNAVTSVGYTENNNPQTVVYRDANGDFSTQTITTDVGINFNNGTSGYTPTTLDYYEVFSDSGSTSGCVTGTVNFTYTRIGNIVVYKITQGVGSGSGANAALSFPTIPDRFTPAIGSNIPYFFKDNGAWLTGILQVNNNSTLFALLNPDGAPPLGGNCTFPECSFVWSIT